MSLKYFTVQEQKEKLRDKFDESDKRKEQVEYSSGATYDGEWIGGFRHGYGTMKWTDSAKYEGYWEFGCAQGQGIFNYPSGDVYDGEWYNSQ
jgi:hypothetical protein